MEGSQEHVVLCLSYDGTQFCGFQVQPARRTVQGELEDVLHKLYGYSLRVHPAGRTDTGVHALRQYVHFSQPAASECTVPTHKLSYALNVLASSDMHIAYSRAMPLDFHARYSAQSRTYCYMMHISQACPPPWRSVLATVPYRMHWDLWMQDARELVGTWDFAALCKGAEALHRQGESTVRTVHRVSLVQEGDVMKFFIEANGFLWRMVRIIVGMLMYRAGLSTQAHAQLPHVSEILRACNRSDVHMMGRLAPAHGLYLYDVKYNDTYALEYRAIPPSEY